MQRLLRDESNGVGYVGLSSDTAPAGTATAAPASPALLEVLWRRRTALGMTVLVCVALAVLYVLFATRVYRATAVVTVDPSGPRVWSDSRAPSYQSGFFDTQAEVIQSAAVLSRALGSLNARQLRTFAGVSSDPIEWLRESGAMKVTVGRKADTIQIAIESAYPDEAAAIANGVVDAFIAEHTAQERRRGNDIAAILEREKEQVWKRREDALRAMQQLKLDHGVVSFGDQRSNEALERTTALSTSLTNAEVVLLDLRAQEDSVRAAMTDAASIKAFVEAQQFKGRDFGDREYDEMRTQLSQLELTVSGLRATQAERNPRVMAVRDSIAALRERIVQKERSVAESSLRSVQSQVQSAEANVTRLRAALQAQRDKALHQGPGAAEFARFEAEAARLAKQLEALDVRIAEVGVNAAQAGPLTVKVVESAQQPTRPVRPRKMLALAIALVAGWVLGLSAAMLREWQDARLHTPEEIPSLLHVPLMATVPQINPRLSPVTRGQLVRLDPRSPASEAYRSIRTSLHLGSASQHSRTILLASPTQGDGKSTTASNLALAFAQAGERTLLIDCDLRKPVQHLIFEVEAGVGLSSVMAGEAKLAAAIQPAREPNLYILPAGPVPDHPSELLASKRFARLMHALGETFDRIVIDSPPLMSVTDARILAASSDVTLLVLRMNRSMRTMGALALDGLDKVGANVLGAVANDVPPARPLRDYGGSWRYAPYTRRMLTVDAVTSGAAVQPLIAATAPGDNGDHDSGGNNGSAVVDATEAPHPASNGEHVSTSAPVAAANAPAELAIEEPDWSKEEN